MDGADSPQLHVVMFPWLAFGHLLPCLELAERLAARGHRVSFLSTPRNIARLRPVAPALAPLIDLVALPLPRVDGLPEGAEATSDIPPGKTELHLKAFDSLAAPFSAFLDAACAGGSDKKIDWIVVDSFHYWAAAAAHARKVPCVLSMTYSAATSAQYGVPCDDQCRESTAVDDLGPSLVQRFLLTFEKCKLLAHRTCFELEPESMPLLSNIFGKPVIPVGLLPPSVAGEGGHGEHGKAALLWLDKQPPKSVVYVAFGSEAPLTVEQLHEVALGLELAGTGFLWTLKKPNGVLEADILPSGFQERTRGRGFVAMGWVPQLSILAHSSVGAFMTHCGWSSTIEGLLFGHPLIMMPFLGEQSINTRLMERKKVGVQVPRHEGDKSFDCEGVTRAVQAVMSEEEGGRAFFACNARKLQEIVADKKCQNRYIDEFVRCLRSYRTM